MESTEMLNQYEAALKRTTAQLESLDAAIGQAWARYRDALADAAASTGSSEAAEEAARQLAELRSRKEMLVETMQALQARIAAVQQEEAERRRAEELELLTRQRNELLLLALDAKKTMIRGAEAAARFSQYYHAIAELNRRIQALGGQPRFLSAPKGLSTGPETVEACDAEAEAIRREMEQEASADAA